MARRKKQDEEKPNDNINESDDAFGLPEIEYEPLKRDEPVEELPEETPEPVYETTSSSVTTEEYTEEPSSYQTTHEQMVEEEQQYIYTPPQEEPSPVWPKVLLVLILLIVIGGGVWYFGFYKPEQDKIAEAARIEQAKQDEAKRKQQEQAELLKREQDAAEQRRADSIAAANAHPAEGIIETLTGRTGRYYVVVASSIDDDLIKDYAQELKGKGVSSKVIPPFKGVKFYRLAIADRDNYNDAQSVADQMKGDYGNGVWVIRY